MKRDMDLIRRIVLALEETEQLGGFDDVEDEVFAYHAKLLIEAGLAEGTLASGRGVPRAAMLWVLTWAGQDFLSSIRSDTLWNKAKTNVMKPAAAWSFDVLKAYLRTEIAKHLPGLDKLP